ncbi:peptidyl-prolyl cis-trans isomerase [Colwellia sp. Bg11-28]|uniref:peptidylprolyl isomerase n=1 Tax=Colwellia sp. Bg11-28 TaxID=2058305 RepID=UPI000C321AD2|nr:peptidylprolyl isomerase [Colwellia sp. Bg11-28]PKH88683.1 peptidyl-prolyl cis-trans isomerase [Colwellia sp. Bg11-28]
MLKKLITEPLVHFLVIAILLFIIFEQLNAQDDNPNTITISQGRIEQIKQNFLTRWNRAPLAKELENATLHYAVNEMYIREARALNMDRGDKVIDRRLRQKIEFLIEDLVTTKEPNNTELMQFYQQHIENYQTQPLLSFQQVHLSIDGNHDELQQKIVLQQLSIKQGKTPQGDLKLLPYQVTNKDSVQIDRLFGKSFSKQLIHAPLSSWSGPIESSHGVHFVLIEQRSPAVNKAFESIKSTVLADWQYKNLQSAKASFEERLLKSYTIAQESAAKAE